MKVLLLSTVMLFSVLVMQAQDSQEIEYDEVVTGEFDEETYEQFYSFEGQADDVIIVRMTATSEDPRLDSYLYLRDAEGNNLAFDDDQGGNLNSLIGPYVLPEDGTYTIVATRFQQAEGTSMGTYELSVAISDVELISLGDIETVELTEVGLSSILSFEAETAGLYQLNLRTVTGEDTVDVSVQSQDGNYYAGVYLDNFTTSNFAAINLEAGEVINLFMSYYGAYDVEEDEQTGVTIEISIQLVEPEVLELEINEPLDLAGVLDDAESVAYYSFEANSSETLSIEGSAPNGGEFDFYVIFSAGYQSFYGSSAYQVDDSNILVAPTIINESGEFILVVHRATIYEPTVADDEAVAYELRLNLVNTPELIVGETVEGTINNDEQTYEDAYIYNGTAGETITITLTSLDDEFAPSFSIHYEPQEDSGEFVEGFYVNFNSSVSGVFAYEVELPSDGVYIVYVYNGDYEIEAGMGAYNLLIESN